MKKIVLAPNPYRDRGLALTLAARTMLESDGHSTVISPAFVDVPADSPMQPLGRAAAGADLIITFGGKGSDCHKATVVGDTVGDPFKDTSGPSLNILVKLMSMVSIVMAGLTVWIH